MRILTVVRLALAGFLLFPFAQFAVLYWWSHRTFDGLVPALAVASVDSIGEWCTWMLVHPVQTLLYAGFLALLGRIAFHRSDG